MQTVAWDRSRSIARVNSTMVINNRTSKFPIESGGNGMKDVLSSRSGKFRFLGMERIKVRWVTSLVCSIVRFEQWPPTETEACFFGRVFTRKVACRYDRYLDWIEMSSFRARLLYPPTFHFIYLFFRSIDR